MAKHNIIIDHIKDEFVKLLEVTSNRHGSDYTLEIEVEKYVVDTYTDSYKGIMKASYPNGIEYYLVLTFYDKDDIYRLFDDRKDFNIPDIVTIRLIEDTIKKRHGRLLNMYDPEKFHVITDISISTSKLLNEISLSDMFIDDFLLG